MLFYNGDLEIMAKPRLFIGSSVEGLPVARAIKAELDFDMDVTVWSQGVFKLSHSPLEDLSTVLENSDFASFVFLPEDKLEIRGEEKTTVRDNVVFELGLFYGKLGRDRVSYIMPRGYDLHLPSDLTGVTGGTFESPNTNMQASVGSYCEQIRMQVRMHKINFPATGRFGPNIFADGVSMLKEKCSFKGNVPQGNELIIRISNIDKKTSYGYDVSSFGDWVVEPYDESKNEQLAKLIGPSNSDMCLRIHAEGNINIQAYEKDTPTPILSKNVLLIP